MTVCLHLVHFILCSSASAAEINSFRSQKHIKPVIHDHQPFHFSAHPFRCGIHAPSSQTANPSYEHSDPLPHQLLTLPLKHETPAASISSRVREPIPSWIYTGCISSFWPSSPNGTLGYPDCL
ncbi:hypothetical protein AVEN_202148-1 [Araneus ventricosus]|uniref:Uncharacterized protein n=1 Tax=Araneus ventricosus TaxID=182803 RepID=A0A4Y2E3H9_ARAVE|nr:hypothetical protein AVEN_202148-1 [Araneus ventricosus]